MVRIKGVYNERVSKRGRVSVRVVGVGVRGDVSTFNNKGGFMMWIVFLAICSLGIVVVGGMITYSSDNDVGDAVMGVLFGSMVASLFCMSMLSTIIPMTSGMYKGYSTGERDGYVTKISQKGVIWKTYEAQIQIGTGQMAALQEPFEFSIDDKELLEKLNGLLGKKVRISYTEWLIMPYRIGESGYLLTDITLLKGDL